MERTLIDAQTTVLGGIEGSHLEVAGRVKGHVLGRRVRVLVGGHIEGGLTAEEVFVAGTVEGPIQAARVEVAGEGQALGGIQAPTISLADGCTIHGRLDSRPPEALPSNLPQVAPPTPQWSASTPPTALPLSQLPAAAEPAQEEPITRAPRRAPRRPPRAPDLSHMTLTPGEKEP